MHFWCRQWLVLCSKRDRCAATHDEDDATDIYNETIINMHREWEMICDSNDISAFIFALVSIGCDKSPGSGWMAHRINFHFVRWLATPTVGAHAYTHSAFWWRFAIYLSIQSGFSLLHAIFGFSFAFVGAWWISIWLNYIVNDHWMDINNIEVNSL